MCLVILILPLARVMKNLKAHSYFREFNRFLPFSIAIPARRANRVTRNLCVQTKENKNVHC